MEQTQVHRILDKQNSLTLTVHLNSDEYYRLLKPHVVLVFAIGAL